MGRHLLDCEFEVVLRLMLQKHWRILYQFAGLLLVQGPQFYIVCTLSSQSYFSDRICSSVTCDGSTLFRSVCFCFLQIEFLVFSLVLDLC